MGGLWTGEHTPSYKPQKDPRNFSPCKYCNATGIRTDSVGIAYGMDKNKTCNGCNGTGKSLNFSLAPHNGDIMEVSKISPKLKCHTLIVNGQVFLNEEFLGINKKPYFRKTARQTVKQKLNEMRIKDGYLVTTDYHS